MAKENFVKKAQKFIEKESLKSRRLMAFTFNETEAIERFATWLDGKKFNPPQDLYSKKLRND